MKTSLTSFALVLTIALPTALAAAIFGATLPVSFGLDEAFELFVAALTGLTLTADYSKRRTTLTAPDRAALIPTSSALATEDRRLAA